MKWAFGYIVCIIAGCAVAYLTLSLPPSVSDKPAVDVNVHIPEPKVIHDTIIKPDVKYRYIYKNKCCCGTCAIEFSK